MNKVILLGNIANDIELRQSQNGTLTTRFRIACRRNQDETDFINCTAFNKTAELISKHFSKGARILVEGSIKTGSYDDKNTGKKIYTTDVWISSVDFPEKSQNTSAVTQNAPAPQGQPAYNQRYPSAGAQNQQPAPPQNYGAPPSAPPYDYYQDYGNPPY